MTHILVSYSRKDEDEVRDLLDELKGLRVNLWLDSEQISPGEHWIDSIKQAISNSEKMMVILSPNSAASEWVDLELKTALKREKAKPIQIIPVVIAGEPEEVLPASLKALFPFDARDKDENTLRRLASVLQTEPGAP